jgi:hypothetical protein
MSASQIPATRRAILPVAVAELRFEAALLATILHQTSNGVCHRVLPVVSSPRVC